MIVKFLSIIFSFLLLFFLKVDFSYAGGGDFIVNPVIVIPSDWRSRISPATEQRYKQNFLNTLEDVKQFYVKKLHGHTFIYDTNVGIINARGTMKDIPSAKTVPDMLPLLGVNDAPYGHIYVFVLIGSGNRNAQGGSRDPYASNGNGGSGQVYLGHEQIEEMGSSDHKTRTLAIGTLAHELGHALGLTYGGWADAHPCSVISKDNCINMPGLGTTIAYPPESEYLKSIIGVGFYNMDSPDVGFDDSIYNPEVQKLYKTPFINPNGDPPPPLENITLVTPVTLGKITYVSPNPVAIGQELVISGSGFGNKPAGVEFSEASTNVRSITKYELKSWTDSEIRVTLLEGLSYLNLYNVVVTTYSGLRITSPQSLTVNPKASPGKITQISPNMVAAGDEITIKGSGFGDKTGGIQFTEAGTPSNFPFTIKYGITKWTDSEVKIVLLEELKKFPATISVLTASGEKIISFQSLHPKTSTPSPSPKPQITQVLPNPIPYKNTTIQVLGSGFGDKPIGVRFDNFSSPYPAVGFDIKSYTDSEIKIFVSEFPKRVGDWIFSVDNGSFQPATAKLNIDYTETSTPTPSPQSPSPSPSISTQTPSPSPLAITQIRISNYKDFRDNLPSDDGSATQTFNSPSSGVIIWKKSTINPNLPIYIAPMNPDGSNAPILEISLSNGQQLQVPNSSFTVQAKVIRKIVKIVINGQEVSSNFGQSFSIHLPGVEGIEGTYEIPVIITYNDGSIKALPFKFHYAPVAAPIVPSPESISPSPQAQTLVPTCGSAYPGGSCSVNEVGQTRKNDCTTVSGLGGQSIMECKRVGDIYCWYDAYTDPANSQVKSQFCYENRESSISGLGANPLSCASPTCLRGTPTQRPSDGSWYCYEGERWVGNAMCLATAAPTLSTCDPQKVKCATGEISIRSVNGNWVCANISTGQITNTVPTCSQ